MTTRRLRRVSHPGDNGRMQQELVTVVRDGEYVLGANVWARGRDEAVFVSGDDLKRVAEELQAPLQALAETHQQDAGSAAEVVVIRLVK